MVSWEGEMRLVVLLWLLVVLPWVEACVLVDRLLGMFAPAVAMVCVSVAFCNFPRLVQEAVERRRAA